MFTGIVEAMGEIRRVESRDGDLRLLIGTGQLDLSDTGAGDSIAVNGVCLSVIGNSAGEFTTDVSLETLAKTTLADITTGSPVNLERAMLLSDRLHGHLVSGHVDGTGIIRESNPDGRSEQFIIEAPAELMRFICVKGSICVDGVSLTVNAAENNTFTVNIIPHTKAGTLFNHYRRASRVNLEVDMIARYLDSLSQSRA